MATTTTNYGFDVPTSSDLVKNGATQIALLGQDLDTFLFRPFSRNGLLNSGFDVWQRATSISLAASTGFASGFTADRWQTSTGANQGCTISRQLVSDSTNLPNIEYAARYQRNSGQTGTGTLTFMQNIETLNSVPFAGKTVTLSFYARKGANYSQASSALVANLISGTGTDQNAFTGLTGSATVISQSATLTTTWQRFTYSATVSSSANQLSLYFDFAPVGTAGAADYFDITGVQIEVGSQASPYAPATPTYATELAACQRYYYRTSGSAAYYSMAQGVSDATTSAKALFQWPVTLRTASTDITYGNLYWEEYQGTASVNPTVTAGGASNNVARLTLTGMTGLTAGRVGYLFSNNSSTSYIAINAEL
jgi:hypothetical protein